MATIGVTQDDFLTLRRVQRRAERHGLSDEAARLRTMAERIDAALAQAAPPYRVGDAPTVRVQVST